jgi:hypothetical protein
MLALLWLVPFGTGQELKAKDTAKIVSKRIVDVCGQRRDQVILVIDLGKILKSDSLFGCNFQLSYDSTKLRFHSALYLNTLAEFFEFKQVGFVRSGKIIGVVATLGMQPTAGDRPLVGFLGDYLGSCSDSVKITIDYLEFTDEFKKEYVYLDSYVVGKVADKPERYFKLTTDRDSTIIDSLATESIFKIKVKQGIDFDIDSLGIKFYMGNFDNFYVKSVESADTDLLKIENLEITDDSVNISFFVNGKLNNREIAIVNIAEKKKGEEVAEILISPEAINNDCSCFSRKISGNHYVKSLRKKDDTTTAIDDNDVYEGLRDYYLEYNNEWIIESKRAQFRVRVYNIIGNLVVDKQCYFGISRISLDRFSNGVYYGVIQYSDNKIKRKILIKN